MKHPASAILVALFGLTACAPQGQTSAPVAPASAAAAQSDTPAAASQAAGDTAPEAIRYLGGRSQSRPASQPFDPRMREIEAQILDAFASVRCYTAEVSTEVFLNSFGSTLNSHSQGTVQYLRDGAHAMFMQTAMIRSNVKTGEAKSLTQFIRETTDGVSWIRLIDDGPEKTHIKAPYDPKRFVLMGKPLFDQLRGACYLQYSGEDVVDGTPVHVIEAELSDSAGGFPIVVTRYFFRRADGILMGSIGTGAREQRQVTVYRNIQVNGSVERGAFEVPAPPGAVTKDYTTSGGN